MERSVTEPGAAARRLRCPPANPAGRGQLFYEEGINATGIGRLTEVAGTFPAVREAVTRHKQGFARHLAGAARVAGAADPKALARQLAVLFEGAKALTTSLPSHRPEAGARAAAEALIHAATTHTTPTA